MLTVSKHKNLNDKYRFFSSKMAYREESTKVVHLTGKLSSCHCKFEASSIQHPLHSFTVPGSQFLSYITWGMMYMEKYCTENLWSLDLNSALQCPDVTNNPGLNFKDDRVKQTQQCSAVMGENIATDDYVSHLCRNRLRGSATRWQERRETTLAFTVRSAVHHNLGRPCHWFVSEKR